MRRVFRTSVMYLNLLKLGIDEFKQDERIVDDRAYLALPYHA